MTPKKESPICWEELNKIISDAKRGPEKMSETSLEEKETELKNQQSEKEKDGGGDTKVESPTQSVSEDYKAKFYYLAAESENMRKRFEREKDNWIKYGNEKILSSLLEVVDNLDLTLGALVNENDAKVKNIGIGIEMVRKQFLEVLGQNGLTLIESMGKIFDPNFHEAMGQKPAEGKKENEIIFEYKKGYLLNGRLLRAAKVIVAKNEE